MRDIGMTADDVSFSSAIISCEKGGQLVQALVLLDKMLVVETTKKAHADLQVT